MRLLFKKRKQVRKRSFYLGLTVVLILNLYSTYTRLLMSHLFGNVVVLLFIGIFEILLLYIYLELISCKY